MKYRQRCGLCRGSGTIRRPVPLFMHLIPKESRPAPEEPKVMHVEATCPHCGGMGWEFHTR